MTLTVRCAQRLRRASVRVHFPEVVGKIAIGLVLLAALTAPWTGIKLSSGGAPADVLIVLALGVVALMVVFGDLRFSVPAWPLIPCVAIMLCVLVRQLDPAPAYLRVLRMQIYGYYPDDITKALFWFFALLFVPTAIVACSAIDRRAVVWTMGAFVAGTTLSCAVAIGDLIGLTPNIGRFLGESTQICTYTCFNAGGGTRMNGLTDHPNTLGITAAISIPIAVYFATTMRRTWIPIVAVVLLLGGILASGSRGAQAVAPVCALASVFSIPKGESTGRIRSVAALATVLGGLVVAAALPARVRTGLLRTISGSPDSAGSNSERLRLFRAAVADWQAHPIFGSGIRHLVEAHNVYLQFLASGGLVLAMAMLVYFFLIFRACRRSSREGFVFARFLMISFGTWLVLGLVENAIADRYLYYAVGSIAALSRMKLPSRQHDSLLSGHHVGRVLVTEGRSARRR